MPTINLARKLLSSLFVFLLIFTFFSQVAKPASAACDFVFSHAITTQNGDNTLVVFNSSVLPSATKVGTAKIKGKNYDIVSVANKPYAVAQVPKQTGFSVSYSDSDGSCSGVSTSSQNYDPTKDPYQSTITTGERWKVVTDSDGDESCVLASDGNGPYINKLTCEAHGLSYKNANVPCNPTCSIGGVLEFDTGDSGGSTVTTILTVSISIAAVVAFILAGFGAVKIVTSAGNPSGINAGREMIISAISGLLFIVFAVTILEIIGANILNLPGIEATSDIYTP